MQSAACPAVCVCTKHICVCNVYVNMYETTDCAEVKGEVKGERERGIASLPYDARVGNAVTGLCCVTGATIRPKYNVFSSWCLSLCTLRLQ